MIDLLIEIKKAVDERRATSDRLDPVQIKGFEERYDRVIEDGMAENPSPISRGQPGRRGRKRCQVFFSPSGRCAEGSRTVAENSMTFLSSPHHT
jgi:hypothetical protein